MTIKQLFTFAFLFCVLAGSFKALAVTDAQAREHRASLPAERLVIGHRIDNGGKLHLVYKYEQ